MPLDKERAIVVELSSKVVFSTSFLYLIGIGFALAKHMHLPTLFYYN